MLESNQSYNIFTNSRDSILKPQCWITQASAGRLPSSAMLAQGWVIIPLGCSLQRHNLYNMICVPNSCYLNRKCPFWLLLNVVHIITYLDKFFFFAFKTELMWFFFPWFSIFVPFLVFISVMARAKVYTLMCNINIRTEHWSMRKMLEAF